MGSILVVDVNHGALDISKEYLLAGKDVIVWDIYGKIDKDVEFKEKNLNIISNLKIIPKNTVPDFSKYSEVIAPVHCPIDVDFKTFHEAVSEIIMKKYPKVFEKLITVTGVKGKTTTTEIINHILSSKYTVFLHNSNYGSITPVTVLNKLDELEKNGNLKNYDFFIFEVSLGVISSKYSILTNIVEDYKIAGGRRSASVKINSLKNSENIYIDRKTYETYGKSLKNAKIIENTAKIVSKYPLSYEYNGSIFELNDSVLGFHFVENSVFAFELCSNFMDLDEIKRDLKDFQIKNRMEVEKNGKYVIVKNINPGLDLKAINYAIDDFLSIFKIGTVIIGGDLGCTCEEIDVTALYELLLKYDTKSVNFLLSGDLGQSLKEFIDFPIVERKNYEFKDNTLVIYRSKIA